MQKLVKEYLSEWKKQQKKRRRISIAVMLLIVMVVSCVIGSLTQYGVALTGAPKCGMEEHQHNDSCYTSVLTCGQEESEGHQHNDSCYTTTSELTCRQEEGEEHRHDDSCYTETSELTCGQEESDGHTHTDECYTEELACGMKEHTHTDECYIDTDADVEDAAVWNNQYKDVEWKETWSENLVIAAQMQIGYKESSDNYIVSEDGSHKGYTRYGQFATNAEMNAEDNPEGNTAGDAYRDWDAAFVNFCIYYAGLTNIDPKVFPEDLKAADTTTWCEEFGKIREENGNYLAEPKDHTPAPGDIVFSVRENEETEGQMGIVSSYNKETNEIKVIEGNSGNEVRENTYDANDEKIVSYLMMAEIEKDYKATLKSDENNGAADEMNPAENTDSAGTTEQTDTSVYLEQEPDEQSDGKTDKEPQEQIQEQPQEQPKEESQEQTKEITKDQPEDQPLSFNTYSRVVDLGELKTLEVGAATEDTEPLELDENKDEDNTWSFNAYYVDQDDRTDILKTTDFNLKYQMEFHTSKNFKANEIAVRVERKLFDFRSKEAVLPDQIAVPPVNKEIDEETGEEKEVPVVNKNMPFNYRIITENGTEYLEFFNYTDISAGTNVAWQILYKNLKIMQITDGQNWKLNPEIIIWDTDKNGNPVYGTEKTKRFSAALKGQIDSSVRLGNVTKKAYHKDGKQYTPELYTASQVRAYTEKISSENETKFFEKDNNGKEILNPDYYYAVWEVTMRGSASQPWKILIDEKPGAQGTVVGYKDNFNKALGYDVSIDSGTALKDKIAIAQNEKTSWSSRFYVVTAYPKNNVKPGETEISNEIEIKAVPCDGKDEPEVKTAKTEFTYKNFKWTYPDDAIGVEKESDDGTPEKEEPDYSGWLEVYKRSTEDYGDIPFTSLGTFRGYGLTHETTGEKQGQYKDGTAYKLITADDFMYVVNGEQYTMLEKDDYYYSGVTITQRDYGYDIWEDAETSQPEKNGNMEEQNVVIYAKYGAAGENDDWKEVATVPWDNSGIMSYTFTSDQIARQPYRVKVGHVSTNYRTTCEIKVKVRIKKNAPHLQNIMQEYGNGNLSSIRFEDLSGVIAQTKKTDGTWELTDVTKVEAGNKNYSEPGLIEKTKNLYEELSDANISDRNNFPMYRDNAYATVTGLKPHAKSDKAVTSITNDVINRRGQVIYSLTAHDGYGIFSEEAVTELKRQGMESPGSRTDIAFYDLLPEGMTFDPSYTVTAGRIKELDSKGNYKKQPGLWDSGEVTVTWETKENYNKTGRTMVIFHLHYSGNDAAVYTNENWMEGWGVSFRAYYDWEDTKLVQKGRNISAFMPHRDDEKYGDENYPLLGGTDEVACDNGAIVPSDYDEKIYEDFGKDIDGNSKNDNFPNVLYAENDESESIAQSYNSTISKQVRADADKYSPYRASAVVEENGTYTYNIRVSTGTSSLKNLIVYDHLENAATDRQDDAKDPNSGFESATWTGTFQSVMTSELTKLGIEPVVYYSTNQNAPMPKTKDDLETVNGDLANLKDSNGNNVWIKAEKFKEELKDIKSVAVDMRKKTNGEEFVLEAGGSVSFRIQMKAPEIKNDAGYAYNCPIYYSTSENDIYNELQFGDSVKVNRKKAASLEVVKVFGAEVPDSVKDTAFEFSLTDKRDVENPQSFSYQVYKLYKKGANGEWKNTPEAGQYATDGHGLLELHADEKAVFEQVANVSGIEVKEKENIFWKSHMDDPFVDNSNDSATTIRTVTVTNTYRPVLYVQKKLEGIPDEIDVDALNPEFTFKVQAEKDGKLEPLSNQEYYYVKEARTDGGIPRIDTSKGVNGKSSTEADGTFNIHKGEIIAVFPGDPGTKYEVKEVTNEKSDEDWFCREDTAAGTLPVRGATAVIQNYYRWRELYLTKEITHQTQACDKEFTFQIQKVENGETVSLTPGEIKKLNLTLGYMSDGEFCPIYVGDIGEDSGDAGVDMMALDLTGNEYEPLLPGAAGVLNGGIDVNLLTGQFSCACANMTIRIKGLEAGKTYVITEIVDDNSLYLPVEDSVKVTMPLYGDKKEATITNDYQMRPLSVTKKVVSSTGNETDDATFTMQVLVNGKPLKNHPYRIQDSNVSGGNAQLPGGNQSILSQTGSQNVLQSGTGLSMLAQSGSSVLRLERGMTVRPPQGQIVIPTTGENGMISLKDGQTAILIDAGKLGDTFEVIEQKTEGYTKIAPAGNGEGVFSGEGGEVVFVNAKDSDGKNLYISKVYEAEQMGSTFGRQASNYVNQLKEAPAEGAVEVTLTIGGEVFTGGIDKKVTVVNQLTGDTSEEVWNGSTFTLNPWSVVIIPIEESAKDISYTLSESKEDQHRIVGYKGSDNERDPDGWLEISQKEPKNDRAVEGTVAENPVATITNEVKAVGISSLVTKQMTEDSSPVPEGVELVWRVEQFDGVAWQKAEGVSYITLAGDWSKDASEANVVPTCDHIMKTGSDGRIVLTKEQWEDGIDRQPAVYFADGWVFVNLYDDASKGQYRVVEVMEESDEEWGILKEYADAYSGSDGLNLQYYEAGGFVNSNELAPIEIAKAMEGESDETFTMILKQVLSLDPNNGRLDIFTEDWEKNIIASEGRSGIPYTVYDTATGEVVDEKETGKNGEIYLKAGQYARLNLSNTLWTVSEDVGHTFKLKSLTPESEGRLRRLNPNLMLINGDFTPTYTVRYEDGTPDNAFEPQIHSGLKAGDRTPAFVCEEGKVDLEGNPAREEHIFMGWSLAVNSVVSADDANANGEIVYTATWDKKKTYTVTYTDGVKGETVFSDQGYENLLEGEATPEFVGTPERDGYTFIGWSPEWNLMVSRKQDPDENREIVYTAQWAKKRYIFYYDENGKQQSSMNVIPGEDGYYRHKVFGKNSASWLRERSGKLLGWATLEGDTKVEYQPGVEVALEDEDLNLYAVWEE